MPAPRTIAENPWFWLALFGGVGLVGIMLIAPKFGARWARVERMQETRTRIAQEKAARITAGEKATAVEQPKQPKPTDAPPEPEPYVESDFQESMPLKYLLGLMMVVMMVGTTGLLITRGRERRAASTASPPPTAEASTTGDSSKADA
jgi:hypothetical protein